MVDNCLGLTIKSTAGQQKMLEFVTLASFYSSHKDLSKCFRRLPVLFLTGCEISVSFIWFSFYSFTPLCPPLSLSPWVHFHISLTVSTVSGKWKLSTGNSQLTPRQVYPPDKISLPIPRYWPLLCLKGCLSVIAGAPFCPWGHSLFPSPPCIHFLSTHCKLKRDFSERSQRPSNQLGDHGITSVPPDVLLSNEWLGLHVRMMQGHNTHGQMCRATRQECEVG